MWPVCCGSVCCASQMGSTTDGTITIYMWSWVCIIRLVTTVRIRQNLNPLMLCTFSLYYIKQCHINKTDLPTLHILHTTECLKPEVHKSWALRHLLSKICITVPNICGPLVWNIFRVTLLAPIIFIELLELWKICATMSKTTYNETMLQDVNIVRVHAIQ
jgi:hypothetical protein